MLSTLWLKAYWKDHGNLFVPAAVRNKLYSKTCVPYLLVYGYLTCRAKTPHFQLKEAKFAEQSSFVDL